jgi:hypothetical protein
MKPGTIFISHRAEYGSVVGELKNAIESTSRGKIHVAISEDLKGSERWRKAIEEHLEDAERLFLIYGAPYEDWSWCFYEAGYFAALDPGEKQPRSSSEGKPSRPIYCIKRPNVPAPGPLSDLQMVTDKERLIADLIDIYGENKVEYDAGKLRKSIDQAADGLFGRLEEFVSYPRLYFIANNADFRARPDLPAGAVVKGERVTLTSFFGIGKDEASWSEIVRAGSRNRTPQEVMFFSKWADEMKEMILASRENRVLTPQTVLIRGGQRARFLLYVARTQGDGVYCCEFLVIDEVGGPALGLSQQQLALLTSVRMGFRFRYEFIKRFADDPADLADDKRRSWIRDIPLIIDSMLTESNARGNVTLQDLQGAFDEEEAERIGKIVGYWPGLKDNLYGSLGLSPDRELVSDQGLIGPNIDKYRTAFEALRLINMEFLSRCCARVSRMTTRPEDELRRNAEVIERNVRALSRLKAPPAPRRRDPHDASGADRIGVVPLPVQPDPVSPGNQPHV